MVQGNLSFDKAWKKKNIRKFQDVDVYCVSAEQILDLKKESYKNNPSREKDLKDIIRLEKYLKDKNKNRGFDRCKR